MIYVQCSTVWLEMPSQLISIMHMAWFGHFLSFSCWISAINMNGCKFQHDCMPKNIAKTFFLTELSVNVRKFWPSYAGFQFNVPNIKSQVKKKKAQKMRFLYDLPPCSCQLVSTSLWPSSACFSSSSRFLCKVENISLLLFSLMVLAISRDLLFAFFSCSYKIKKNMEMD